MTPEKDPKFLIDKLESLKKVRATSTSPSEKGRLERCIKKTKKRLKEVRKKNTW